MVIYAKLQCTCNKCNQLVSSYMKECPSCHVQLNWNTLKKKFQTHSGHILDALKILNKYIEINQDTIEQFCERWKINKETFLECVFIAVYFHDIGKLTVEFQNNIKNGKYSWKEPHAYYALSILNSLKLPDTLEAHIISVAILGHHRQLSEDIYDHCIESKVPTYLQEDIQQFINGAVNVYSDLYFNRWFRFNILSTLSTFSSIEKMTPKQHRQLRNKIKNTTTDFSDKENTEKIKSMYCFLLSILKICDCYASAEFSVFINEYNSKTEKTEYESVIKEPEKYISYLPAEMSCEKILDGNTPYSYQRDDHRRLCGDVPFFALLFAPCGRGKTETSLIWALKAAKKYKRNKIVFAMPTQITSNAMWERFCLLLGEGKSKTERIANGKSHVGLFHGKSFIILKDQKDDIENEENLDYDSIEEVKSENFKGNVFFKPINVTTIDHLVLSFIHGFSQADFALGNLQNSVIVFDEVHYYEEHTLEHLMTLIDLLKKMRIPTLLMSGTLPQFFISKVREINPEFQETYSDDEGLLFQPFKILLSDKTLVQQNLVNEQVVTEIVENYQRRLVQFVILNTVERCKAFHAALIKQLPENRDTIVLHNSQFTYKDRADKEKNILQNLKENKIKPFILVTTQVLEISLDVSCDIMYTELAPIDALGQRGGRLNRKGKHWCNDLFEYVMKIFITEEYESTKKRPYEPALLINTKNVIEHGIPYSYLKFKQLCDAVYTDYQLTTPTNLLSVFHKCSLFGYSQYDINFGDEEKAREFQLRNSDVQKIDVIPWCCYENEVKKLDVENQVSIPLHQFNNYKNRQLITKEYKNNKKWYWVAKIPYTKETGFDFSRVL